MKVKTITIQRGRKMVKILFSMVGRSDPISNDYDGSIIHILRWYHMDKVYLYLTKEMVERNKNNTYELAIKAIRPVIEINIIEKPDIVDPSEYGLIDKDLKDELERIKKFNIDAEIYVNLTSGTQQMCASLNLVCAQLSFDVKLIQVKNPSREKSSPIPKYFSYKDGTKILEESYDSLQESGTGNNRCTFVQSQNIIKMMIKEQTISLINAYQYYEAYKLLINKNHFFTDELILFIKKMNYKYNGDEKRAKEITARTDIEIYPVANSTIRSVYEYIIFLKTKQELGVIGDFARAFSPVCVKLIILTIHYEFNIDIEKDYTELRAKGKKKVLSFEKLSKLNINLDSNENEDLSTIQLKKIFDALCTKDRNPRPYYTNIFEKLRLFESEIRNPFAHDIRSFSDKDIKIRTNTSTKEIMSNIMELFNHINPNLTHQIQWELYHNINQEIIKMIKGA